MTRADRILLVIVLALLPLVYLAFWRPARAGDTLVVWSPVTGEKRYDLRHDRTLRIPGNLGVARIDITGGKARFIHSPCHGKQCIQHGWVGNAGDFIACLPNRVSIEVRGHGQRFDAVNF